VVSSWSLSTRTTFLKAIRSGAVVLHEGGGVVRPDPVDADPGPGLGDLHGRVHHPVSVAPVGPRVDQDVATMWLFGVGNLRERLPPA